MNMKTKSEAARDNRDLAIVRARAEGVASGDIAERLGLHEAYVRTMSNRIRQADLDESGEDRKAVFACYWSGKPGARQAA
ncbi:hypothetical protein [Paracoccus sp. SM22M-07]|uniref:hypothetical protein n=1 Tax=Paracoccus sp. SM22M-07 TaxID=1520813 RepID=UPI001114E05D|nr:hypothetical protein [Paracoccus sp. SM22M-07]